MYSSGVIHSLRTAIVQLNQRTWQIQHKIIQLLFLLVVLSTKRMAEQTTLIVQLPVEHLRERVVVDKELLEDLVRVPGEPVSSFELCMD